MNNKDQIQTEIRDILQGKAKITLKIWLRVKNIENAVSYKLFIFIVFTILSWI
jgi:hypothetical protein